MIGLSIDPGVSNGICLFQFGEDQPFEIIELWQFKGGAAGLTAWLEQQELRLRRSGIYAGVWRNFQQINVLVMEKFTPHDDENFNLTLEACEPLVCEGVMIGRFFGRHIIWRQPSMQYFMGDSRLPKEEKKKLARKFLETNGLLPSAKEHGWPDNNDAVSAILHAISYLRKIKHMPTITKYFPERTAP